MVTQIFQITKIFSHLKKSWLKNSIIVIETGDESTQYVYISTWRPFLTSPMALCVGLNL